MNSAPTGTALRAKRRSGLQGRLIGPKGRRPPTAALIGALGTGGLTSALVNKESQDGDTGAVPGEGYLLPSHGGPSGLMWVVPRPTGIPFLPLSRSAPDVPLNKPPLVLWAPNN